MFSILIWGFIFALLSPCWSLAQDSLEKIRVTDQIIFGPHSVQDRIIKVESVDLKNPKVQTSGTFSEIIDLEKGVDSNLSCAFCGSKRVTINGLKGEQTSLLIDGLSLLSSISSFYSVDSIPTSMIESIEVYRGAGSSVLAPESIGGALHIQLKEPFKNEIKLRMGVSDLGSLRGSLSLERRVHSQHAILLGVEGVQAVAEDHDANGVTEVPWQDQYHGYLKSAHQWDQHQLVFRFNRSALDVVGGNPKKQNKSETTLVAQKEDFQEGDTRKKFVGDVLRITDNINLQRDEIAIQHSYQVSDTEQFQLSLGKSLQRQNSVYSHGYDYASDDQIETLQVQWKSSPDLNQYQLIGIQGRNQKFNSESNQLYQVLNLKQDDSDSRIGSFFFESAQVLNNDLQLLWGIRADSFETQWRDLGSELSTWGFAPKVAIKVQHHPHYLSRFYLGRGQRVPLSLFESQHGTTEHGFTVAIDQLETADTYSYQGLWQTESWYSEVNVQRTYLQNMAYAREPALSTDPLEFANSTDSYWVSMLDLSYGVQVDENWTFEMIGEIFDYPSGYKEKLPAAAIEKRIQIQTDYQLQSLKLQALVNVIFERNLSDYGYLRNFNQLVGDLVNPDVGVNQKKQTAPTFFTLDLTLEKEVSPNWKWIISLTNLFDYTQTSAGESPLSWEKHGDHYHLDNRHLWGPLKGRQIFSFLEGTF